MSKITALRTGRGQGNRINRLLEGKSAFGLDAEVTSKEGLKVGQAPSADRIEALTQSDHFHRYFKTAIQYLSYRPRSESELRERLQRRGVNGALQEAIITKLKEQRLVDDIAFAQFWKDNRESFSPRSRWLTKLELRRKGVADDTIDQVVKAIDDDESAYRAAQNKAPSLAKSDYQGFRRRLGEYLKRRGFSYEVINHTIEQLWQEQKDSLVNLGNGLLLIKSISGKEVKQCK
ncbi:MAG: RecX family transcriptional regulator [Chloroflexi bacterium]|nr:RecX family transcriptional regulator [Chloroflexota bacterium]